MWFSVHPIDEKFDFYFISSVEDFLSFHRRDDFINLAIGVSAFSITISARFSTHIKHAFSKRVTNC